MQIRWGYQLRAVMLTRCEHGVEQEHPSIGNIFWQLIVEELRLGCLLVPLDQNLADPYRPAAVPQALLHCFAGPHYRDTAYFTLEREANIGAPDGRCYRVLDRRQVVEAFLD